MLTEVVKWVGLGLLLVVLAVWLHAIEPRLSGHVAMGVAAVLVVLVLSAAQWFGIDVFE
jgi:hypothetical protein